jgi:arabinogalactan oligomer/maltooligosaccharide transport system permease protein
MANTLKTEQNPMVKPVPAVDEKKKHEGSIKARRVASDTLIYVILTVMAVFWLLPVVWLLLQSFSGEKGQAGIVHFIPESWGFDNYKFLFTNQVWSKSGDIIEESQYNFFAKVSSTGQFQVGAFLYTAIIAALTAVIATLFTLATSYAFSRLRFKGRTLMMKVILIIGMFPGFLGLIVLYQIFKQMGMFNVSSNPLGVMWVLVICYSGGAGMGYYISKGFFDTISKQIDEAAMVDGATRFQIFYKITLPLSKPIVVYTILTAFMGPWAEFITAKYMMRGGVTNGTSGGVVTVAPQLFDMLDEKTNRSQYFGQFCAGAILVAVPTSLLFIALQKNYVSGVTGGAVKG